MMKFLNSTGSPISLQGCMAWRLNALWGEKMGDILTEGDPELDFRTAITSAHFDE